MHSESGNPLISVIMPAFNAEDHIAEALASVYAQSVQDVEIIVINDGSTDGTAELVRRDFPDVRVISTSNGGVARARNRGIAEARGEFVAFLDADDIWLPGKLEAQLNRFREHDRVMMVFTESRTFDASGIRANPFSKRDMLMKGDLVKCIFLHSFVGTPTVMVRRTVFSDVGVFEEDLVAAEDDNLWMRIAERHEVELIDDVLVHVRLRPGSITSDPSRLFDGIECHIEMLQKKYPSIWTRIGREAVRAKRATNHFMLGYGYFKVGSLSQARRQFAASFAGRARLATFFYLVACALPLGFIMRMKAMRRLLFSAAVITASGTSLTIPVP